MTFKIRALRLTLTCLILFLLTWYYQVPERAWGLITIWFVMFEYTNVGGVFIKSFYRFAGTMMSAIYGLFIIYFFANDVIINMIALVPGIFIYAYFFMDTEKAYIAIIGCVTLTIVLLNHNDIDTAILRTFNVVLGILSAMFMMRFFYPQYAKDEIMVMQVEFVTTLSNIIKDYIDPSKPLLLLQEDMLKNEQLFLAHLVKFNKRIQEASVETKEKPLFIIYHQDAILQIRHIFRLLNVLVHYFTSDVFRTNIHFQHQCHALLSILSTTGQRLTEQFPVYPAPVSSITQSNDEMTQKILDSIHKETLLLDKAIQNIMLQYRG